MFCLRIFFLMLMVIGNGGAEECSGRMCGKLKNVQSKLLTERRESIGKRQAYDVTEPPAYSPDTTAQTTVNTESYTQTNNPYYEPRFETRQEPNQQPTLYETTTAPPYDASRPTLVGRRISPQPTAASNVGYSVTQPPPLKPQTISPYPIPNPYSPQPAQPSGYSAPASTPPPPPIATSPTFYLQTATPIVIPFVQQNQPFPRPVGNPYDFQPVGNGGGGAQQTITIIGPNGVPLPVVVVPQGPTKLGAKGSEIGTLTGVGGHNVVELENMTMASEDKIPHSKFHNIHHGPVGKLAGSVVGKYYFPPKKSLPFPKCFHNAAGYACCNLKLNKLIYRTYKKLKEDPKFKSCNIGLVAGAVQKAAEDMFETPFESLTGLEDFAQRVHFSGDLVCKVEIDGKYILAYATPYEDNTVVDPTIFDNGTDISEIAKLAPAEFLQMPNKTDLVDGLFVVDDGDDSEDVQLSAFIRSRRFQKRRLFGLPSQNGTVDSEEADLSASHEKTLTKVKIHQNPKTTTTPKPKTVRRKRRIISSILI